jgi:hypothetical protein
MVTFLESLYSQEKNSFFLLLKVSKTILFWRYQEYKKILFVL